MNEPNQHKHDPCIYCGQPDSGPCLATRDTLLEGNKALLVANRKMDEALSRLRDERDAAIQRAEKAEAACAKKTELLRAVRYSMDRAVPFPSLDKITDAINDSYGKDYVKK